MAGSDTVGLSRVTIVAPQTRVDFALPSDAPLAEMLPTLLRFAGERLADEPEARHGWSLTRLGDPPLDIARSPAQLGIRDGEMLYLRPRGAEPPEPVFDDIVDAVASVTRSRPGRWRPENTRRFGVGLGALALLGGAAAALFAGPPHLPGALVALLLSVALLGTAAMAARGFKNHSTGVVLAVLATVYAFVGGLVLLGDGHSVAELSGPHLLLAAGAAILVSTVSAVIVGASVHVFLGAGVVAFALGLGATISTATGAGAAGAAAIVVGVALIATPATPMLSYRLAGLPVPSVPTGVDDLRQDSETVDGAQVLARAERADILLSAMLASLAAVAAGAAVTLAVDGATPELALCAVLGLLSLSRARWFVGAGQRLPLLGAGVVALAAASAAVFAGAGVLVRLAVIVPALLIVAAVSIGFGLSAAGRRRSPMWGRVLDIVEVILILGVLPLIVWVSGLYGWIRSFREG